MASAIDPTKPTTGNALTADVRNNFEIAASEITTNQTNIVDLQTLTAQLNAQYLTLNTEVNTLQGNELWSIGGWLWLAAPQTGAVAAGHVGVDTDDETLAANMWISNVAQNGTDYTNPISFLRPNDGIIVWTGTSAIRYTVTSNPWNNGTYFQVPIKYVTSLGWEPGDGSPINVQFVYTFVDITSVQTAIAALEQSQLYSIGQWLWQAAPQTAGIAGHVGVNTDDETQATQLFIGRLANNTNDMFGVINMLRIGDGITIWIGFNAVRYTLSAPIQIFTDYFLIPVKFITAGGWEPGDNQLVFVQFEYSSVDLSDVNRVAASQTYSVGQWSWRTAVQVVPIPDGQIGLDNTDITQAANVFVSRRTSGSDYFWPIFNLRPGDGLILWMNEAAVRYTVSGNVGNNDPTMVIPVTMEFSTLWGPPGDNSPLNLQFVYNPQLGLQAEVTTLQQQLLALQTQVSNLSAFSGIGTWQWQNTPQSGTIANSHVGVDTATVAAATTLWVTTKSDDGSDWTAVFARLKVGDELLLWERKNSANAMRFDVTAPFTNFTTYCTVPITLVNQTGAESANNADINIQFIIAAASA